VVSLAITPGADTTGLAVAFEGMAPEKRRDVLRWRGAVNRSPKARAWRFGLRRSENHPAVIAVHNSR